MTLALLILSCVCLKLAIFGVRWGGVPTNFVARVVRESQRLRHALRDTAAPNAIDARGSDKHLYRGETFLRAALSLVLAIKLRKMSLALMITSCRLLEPMGTYLSKAYID